MIIRECRPEINPDAKFDEGLRRIYFGNYQAMLIDEGV